MSATTSNSLYRFSTRLIPSLCLFLVALIGLGCLAKKPPSNAPVANLEKNLAELRTSTPATVTSQPETNCSAEAVDCLTDENSGALIGGKVQFVVCVEPPICAGGLLSQHASADEINAWIAKNKITFPLTCRFQEPPRCRLGHTSNCAQRCTP